MTEAGRTALAAVHPALKQLLGEAIKPEPEPSAFWLEALRTRSMIPR